MMKVLFIGATGAVGHQVVPILQGDFEITVAAIGGGKVGDLVVRDVDITDFEAVQELVRAGTRDGGRFDAIVNCAIADPRGLRGNRGDADVMHDYFGRCIEVNARGAYHLYEAAARAQVPRVVYISSLTAVFGAPRYEMIDEDARERPRDVYAACKIFGEHVGRTYAFPRGNKAESFALQVLCLRLGMPYPVFTGSDRAWQDNIRRRRAIVHIDDVARAIGCALRSDTRFGVYSIVSASDKTYIDPQLYEELGYKPGWNFTGEGLFALS